jgi:hypothetical protein
MKLNIFDLLRVRSELKDLRQLARLVYRHIKARESYNGTTSLESMTVEEWSELSRLIDLARRRSENRKESW